MNKRSTREDGMSNKKVKIALKPPPLQLLCEVLSTVCGAEVTVEASCREGWVQIQRKGNTLRSTSSSLPSSQQPAKIVLHLTQATSPTWPQLVTALKSELSSPTASVPFSRVLSPNPGRKGNVRTLVSWHKYTHGSAKRDVIDENLRMFLAGNKRGTDASAADKDGLDQCLSVLGEYLAKILTAWLRKDCDGSPLLEDDESDSEDDLFSDEYRSHARQAEHSLANSTSLGEFLALCSRGDASLLVSKPLLHGMLAPSPEGTSLARSLLRHAVRSLPTPDDTSPLSFDCITTQMAAVTHLASHSAEVSVALVAQLGQEADAPPTDGHRLELSSILRPVFSLGGYVLANAGFEKSRDEKNRFHEALKAISTFPRGYFDYSRNVDPSIQNAITEARKIMRHARSDASRILSHCMRKKGGNGKDVVFSWMCCHIRANEIQTHLLHDQLLDGTDKVHSMTSSRSFLTGASLSLLELCCNDLEQNYEKKGVDVFDARYLIESRINSSRERCLIKHDASAASPHAPRVFSGASQFFFLTAALLRVALFPAIRTQEAFESRYHSTLNQLSDASKSPGNRATRIASSFIGWKTLLDDGELMKKMIRFSILQLRYLADLSQKSRVDRETFSLIPESFIKLPAQYICRIATTHQSQLSPKQAEDIMRYATLLLGSSDIMFSIQVKIELMRISGAFVKASVRLAESKQRRKHPRKGGGSSQEEELIIDKRDLDIYSSLNPNDHGAVVFASQSVSKLLGTSLIRTFTELDAVEGIDVEQEHNFHKHMVQNEIVEVMLRLLCHPSGEFKNSIVSLDSNDLLPFFKALAAAICIDSDIVYQMILDIRNILEHHTAGRSFSGLTAAKLDQCYSSLPRHLASTRRLLLLLVYLSEDENIAALLGGDSDNNESESLGNMIMSLLDKFTAADGGTNALVDFRDALKCASDTAQIPSLVTPSSTKELVGARQFAKIEFGLDVSALSHVLLALATRHCLAANKRQGNTPALIKSIVSNVDFDMQQFQRIFERLIIAAGDVEGINDQELLVTADGHVALSVWKHLYKTPDDIELETSRKQRRYSSVQDKLSCSVCSKVASLDQIKCFLQLLESNVMRSSSIISKSDEEIHEMEKMLMQGSSLEAEKYTAHLSEWVVSEDSFLGGKGNVLDHFFRANAKQASIATLGKIIAKDARKCYKFLPRPHPNSSIFVCYSEERNDICRAIICAPTGTPYSMGAFVFDICYPQSYPAVSPMIHFMTTGGGQVRFSPNLYNDGKVCLSLLGTTEASDQSQRWDPKESSLAQVLLSISSQILDMAEPYYADGGWVGGNMGLQHTEASMASSKHYNNTLRLGTLRHAVIDYLKSPPKGFEDVLRRHFAMCRKRLLIQTKVWTLESKGTELHGRFVKAYAELVVLLSSEKLNCQAWEVNKIGDKTFGALPPLPDDLDALQRLDSGLYNILCPNENGDENELEDFSYGDDEEEINAAMLARAMELSLLESN